jgi:low affinity Fe/Cu permease
VSIRTAFSHFARAVANAIGTPYGFMIALLAVLVWAALGPAFGYSEQWQLIINTGTTIVTFLVVFLIQTTQNRDAKAVHLKLDELVHAISKARDQLIDAEDLTEEELDALEAEFRRLRKSLAGRTNPHASAHENEPDRAPERARERTVR